MTFTMLLVCGTVQAAQVIIQPTLAAYSSQNPGNIGRPAVATVDYSGLTAGPSGVLGGADSTHDNSATPNMWTTAGTLSSPNDKNPFITYDLGGGYNLQTTRLWNYNEAGYTGFGPSSILLSTSVDGTNFSVLGKIYPARAGGGVAQVAQDLATTAPGVRYVRMQILTNWDGAIFWSSITGSSSGGADGRFLTGLSEVRFVVSTSLPIITQQPQPQTVAAGSNAIFTVSASDSGFPPLTYGWRKNGTNLTDGDVISGANTSALVINNATYPDQAGYDVVVANTKFSVTSTVAPLLIGGRLITPSLLAFSSEYNSGGTQRLATNLVSGAGMSGPGYYTDTHDNGQSDVWCHAAGDTSPFVLFDLGDIYNLVATRIWNLNQAGATINGAKDVRISISTDSTNFTILGTNTLAKAGGAPSEPAQDFSTPAVVVRYVKIEPLNGYGGGWNGLSAVRFVANPSLPVENGPYQPQIVSLRQHGFPDWFRDAKFGIWAHWGPQAVPMKGDWYARFMYEQGSGDYNYHVATYGHPSQVGYKDVIPLWKAEKWDPDHLMDLYKKAGAKYFMSMGVHHDNFFMWNSKIHRWNAAQMGPQKDVVGTWAAAARKQGLRFGVSEHLGASKTWWTSSHGSDQSGPLAGVPYDGANPQYWDLYHTPCAPGDTGWFSNDPVWQAQWYNEIKELVDNYDFDIIYSDGALPFGNEVGLDFVANLYNHHLNKTGTDDVVVTIKQDTQGEWAQDIEQGTTADINPYPWQTESSIGDWYYNTGWTYLNQKYRPTSWVINRLLDVVSKNGNLLLNMVLRPDGSLDPEVETMLGDLAEWITIHGEGVYATRPWQFLGEGPAKTAMGGFNQETIYCAQDIRYTTKPGVLYAFTLGWPADGRVTLNALAGNQGRIESVSLLGYNGPLNWQLTPEALEVELPAQQVSKFTACLKIVGDGLKANTLATVSADAQGDLRLSSSDAGLNGTQIKLETQGNMMADIGYWSNPTDWAFWQVKFNEPGRYLVVATYSMAAGQTALLVEADGASLVGQVSQTAGWSDYKSVLLGEMTINDSGVTTVSVKAADPSHWQGINLRALKFWNQSAAGAITLNDNDIAEGYDSNWVYAQNRGLGDYNDDLHSTTVAGASFEYPFVGTGFDYIAEKNSDEGNVDVYIDNVLQQNVSLNNTARLVQQVVFSKTGLSNTNHTLKAVNKTSSTGCIDALRIYRGSQAPAKVNLSATAGIGQAILNWTTSFGAISYNIKRSASVGGPYSTLATQTAAVYHDTGLANGTTYYYMVSANNSFGEGENSSPVSATPGQGVTLVTPTIRNFSSYYNSGSYVRNVTNLVQNNFVAGQRGLTGPGYYTDTHDNGQDDVWHHASGDGSPYVTFDLGGSYNLAITRLWNLNQSGDTENGAKEVRISVSTDAVQFTVLGTNTLAQAGGTTREPAQDFATPVSGIRYVKIEPLNGYGGGWDGLAAVRFEGSLVTLPSIVSQPVSCTNGLGKTAVFTVNASGGAGHLTFQWLKNGVKLTDGGNISGSTSSNLTVSNITLADAGNYAVIVGYSNTVSGVSSVSATLQPVFVEFTPLETRQGGRLVSPTLSAFSSEYNSGDYQRLAANLVNGAGMSGPGYYTDTHGNMNSEVWHHAAGDNSPFVTFDLGAKYNLLITRLWNLNRATDTLNGARDVRISVSADNATFTLLGINTLARAGGNQTEPAQDFATPATAVRFVKIEPLNGYSSANWNGLSAVRFVVADSQPSALVGARLQGISGLHYQVQRATRLNQPDWQVINDIPALPGASLDLPLFDGAMTNNSSQGFYRAVCLP